MFQLRNLLVRENKKLSPHYHAIRGTYFLIRCYLITLAGKFTIAEMHVVWNSYYRAFATLRISKHEMFTTVYNMNSVEKKNSPQN